MPRPRRYREMIGCTLPKVQAELLKAEMKKRKLSVSEFLRQAAVTPLLQELAQAKVEQDEQD